MNLWKGIALIIIISLINPSGVSAELYRWQDDAGQWHFSDRPRNDREQIPELLSEVKAITWEKTPTIKSLTPTKATKGKGFNTQNASHCEKLRQSMRRYQKQSDDNLWDYRSRQKKREYLWEIQKHC